MSDGRDRHSRTRMLLDGFDRALAATETEPLRAWMNLAVLWGYLPEAKEMSNAR